MANIIGLIIVCGLISTAISIDQPQVEDVLQALHRIQQLELLDLKLSVKKQDAALKYFTRMDTRSTSQEDLLCISDLKSVITGILDGQYWALKMIDAWGSLPSGLLTGNMYSLGNFDECLNIRKVISQTRTIRGKYCFLSVSPGEILRIDHPALEALKIRIGTCFPASCSAAQINTFVGLLMNQILSSSDPLNGITIIEGSCQTSGGEPWDGLTILTIVILSLMGFAVGLFTMYDYFLCGNRNEAHPIVRAFSARANSRALFRIVQNKSNQNVIDCLHGIRCMSLIWVVFCHQYAITPFSPNINLFQVLAWAEYPFTSFIAHGFFSVDSFFFLGGLLVSLIALRTMERAKGKLNVPLMYLHRLVRIIPLLAMAILIYTKLMTVVADGPLFKSGYSGKSDCEIGWYWTLLFVNNYTKEKCIPHSWYLSVDMQLFIISPILLISLYKWGKKAAAGILVLIVLLSGCLFATMMVNNYSMIVKSMTDEASQKLYFATHTHAAPWLIGFFFGYFLHINRGKKFQLSKITVRSGWTLCLAMIFTSIFALYPDAKWRAPPLSTLAESFFYTLTRVGWPLSLCWVVFACMQGYGGLANSFLSSPLWQPLSRLSYSVYMWHMFIMEINVRSVRTNSSFSDYQVMLKFWSTFGFTSLLSYLMYLVIEAPFCGLEHFLRPQKLTSDTNKSMVTTIVQNQISAYDNSELNGTETNNLTASD